MVFLLYNDALLEKKNQGLFTLKKISGFPFLWTVNTEYIYFESSICCQSCMAAGVVLVHSWLGEYLHICAMHGTTACQYAAVILHLFFLCRKHCALKNHCLSLPLKMLIDCQEYQYTPDGQASLLSSILGYEREKIIHLDMNMCLGKQKNPHTLRRYLLSAWLPGAERCFHISQHLHGERCAASSPRQVRNWARAYFCYLSASYIYVIYIGL